MSSVVGRLLVEAARGAIVRDLYTGEGAQLYAMFVANDEAEFAEVRAAGDLLDARASVGELASGDGRLLFALDERKIEMYYALDSSAALLSRLSHRATEKNLGAGQLETVCQDILTWQPEEAAFDLLILGTGTARLFEMEQRGEIFRQVRRALRPGGYFYVSTSESFKETDRLLCLGQVNLRTKDVVTYFYEGVLPNTDAREVGFVIFAASPQDESVRIYSSVVHNLSGEELCAEVQQAGFEIESVMEREYAGVAGFHERTTSIIGRIGS